MLLAYCLTERKNAMMFSIRSFVLYAVGTSMCGGLLVLLCLPLCALLRRLRAPSKLLCLLWLAVGLRPGIHPAAGQRGPHSTGWRRGSGAHRARGTPGAGFAGRGRQCSPARQHV